MRGEMTSNSPGLWICIDGLDFTGKGTQTSELIRRLIATNEDNVITYTHEPTRDARKIKDKLKAERGDAYKDSRVMAELNIDDRANNEFHVIRPALRSGGVVVSNRHKYSTLAYQVAQGMDINELIKMHKDKEIGTPDISLLLFLDDEDAIRERMLRTGKSGDKFESDFEFQKKVADNYRKIVELAKDDDFFGKVYPVHSDKGTSIFDVADCIWKSIRPCYDLWTKIRDFGTGNI